MSPQLTLGVRGLREVVIITSILDHDPPWVGTGRLQVNNNLISLMYNIYWSENLR